MIGITSGIIAGIEILHSIGKNIAMKKVKPLGRIGFRMTDD